MPAFRILADDLSGAADCAASLTGAVGNVPLILYPGAATNGPCAIDADTRAGDPLEASARFAELGRHGADGVYKKIDSTLRGHIAVELDALVTALGHVDRVIVAPAFPQQGRTLEEGRVLVNGAPLASWPDGLGKGLAQALGDRYQVESLAARDVEAGDLVARLSAPSARTRVIVADATQDRHLRSLAGAMAMLPGRTLPVGSSGFARAIAGKAPVRIERASLATPMLIIVGSLSAAAREQVGAFRRQHEAFDAHDYRLVHLPFDVAPAVTGDRTRVRELVDRLVDVIPICRTFVVTGGDTARAFLDALGIVSLQILGEIEPGIAVARLDDGRHVVLKAGGFGDNGVFVRLAKP